MKPPWIYDHGLFQELVSKEGVLSPCSGAPAARSACHHTYVKYARGSNPIPPGFFFKYETFPGKF